jgi:hypothetical protein
MKIIQHHLDFRPDENWIRTESGIPFLKLAVDVPAQEIFQEWNTVKDLAVEHRPKESISDKFFYGHKGWKSLTIYGEHYAITENTDGPKNWTSIIDRCPITKHWLENSFVIDADTGRIRFMLIESGGYILPHSDRDKKYLSEINISITNPVGCCFRFTNYGNVPFVPGSAFLMDISNQHLVYNNSDQPRLHIIVHGCLKNTKTITQSYEDRYNS